MRHDEDVVLTSVRRQQDHQAADHRLISTLIEVREHLLPRWLPGREPHEQEHLRNLLQEIMDRVPKPVRSDAVVPGDNRSLPVSREGQRYEVSGQ